MADSVNRYTTGFSQFITISNDPRSASQNLTRQRAIRANAARFARSQEARASAHEDSAHTAAVVSNARAGERLVFSSKQGTNVDLSVRRSPSPTRQCSAPLAYSDPLISAEQSEVAHYFRTSFRVGSWPEALKKEWFQFMANDLLMVNATLSFIWLSYDAETGHISSQTLHYRAQTLKHVRTQVCHKQNHSNDGLIGAIALLSVAACLEGDLRSSIVHMNALTELVTKCGGFEKLSSKQALQRAITWAFIAHSSTFSAYSPFNLRCGARDATTSAMCHDLYTTIMKKLASNVSFFEEVLFPEMFYLIQLLASIETGSVFHARPDTLKPVNSLLIYIEQYLLSADSRSSTKVLIPMDVMGMILTHAAQLYCSVVLRNLPASSDTVVDQAENLQNAFNNLAKVQKTSTSFGETSLLIQLWGYTILFCVDPDIILANVNERSFAEIRELILKLDIRESNMLKESLARISWAKPSFREAQLKALIEKCRQ